MRKAGMEQLPRHCCKTMKIASSDCREKDPHIQQCTGCQKTAEERGGGWRRHSEAPSKNIWKKWVSAGMEPAGSPVTENRWRLFVARWTQTTHLTHVSNSDNTRHDTPFLQGQNKPCILNWHSQQLTTIPVRSPHSNLEMATSSDRCSAALTRWPIRWFRSIDRPSICDKQQCVLY